MIQHKMHNDKKVLIVKPPGPLASEDFTAISRCIQPKVKHFGYHYEDSAMNWIGAS